MIGTVIRAIGNTRRWEEARNKTNGEMGRLDMNKSAIKMQGSANTGT